MIQGVVSLGGSWDTLSHNHACWRPSAGPHPCLPMPRTSLSYAVIPSASITPSPHWDTIGQLAYSSHLSSARHISIPLCLHRCCLTQRWMRQQSVSTQALAMCILSAIVSAVVCMLQSPSHPDLTALNTQQWIFAFWLPAGHFLLLRRLPPLPHPYCPEQVQPRQVLLPAFISHLLRPWPCRQSSGPEGFWSTWLATWARQQLHLANHPYFVPTLCLG